MREKIDKKISIINHRFLSRQKISICDLYHRWQEESSCPISFFRPRKSDIRSKKGFCRWEEKSLM